MKNKTILFIGIDDAGRGPLIGPMVLAGVLVDESIKRKFKEYNIKDSKMLTRKQREELSYQIKKLVIGYDIVSSSPEEIDNGTKDGINLNKREAIKSAEIILNLIKNYILKIKGEKEITIYIDCPSPNILAWQNNVLEYIDESNLDKEKINIIMKCEHKADVNHIECSAASIIGKVHRDEEIEKLKKIIGHDFGSGYPSDPLTIKFMKEHSSDFENHGIFRKSWGTWKNHVKEKEQKKIGEF